MSLRKPIGFARFCEWDCCLAAPDLAAADLPTTLPQAADDKYQKSRTVSCRGDCEGRGKHNCRGMAAAIRKDYPAAITAFQKAASAGNPIAQFNLGVMYGKGLGVARNYPEALSLFQQAAIQGRMEALTAIGICYIYGHGASNGTAPRLMILFYKGR